MRAVLQRVKMAQVDVDGQIVGRIGRGLLVFVGALQGDTEEDVRFIGRKLASIRLFPDDAGKMNLSVSEIGGQVLLVSQFTLAANTTSGTRPSFSAALEPPAARQMLNQLAAAVSGQGIPVETGEFGAKMSVELTNDGPVTIVLDSRDKARK